ncbi:MAG: rhodanese-like domain-containing protein [Thermaurantimonas sp.]
MGFLDFLFGKKPDFNALLRRGAIIVDVRTPPEYKSGHIGGSKNIPLDTLHRHIDELKASGKPVITCCRSGARSRTAVSLLRAKGIESYNGGAWTVLKDRIKAIR